MDVNDAGGNIKLIDLNRGNYTNNIVGNVLGWHPMTNDTGFAYLMTGSPGYTDQAVIIRAGYPNVANNSLTEAQVWLDTYPWLVYPDPVVTNSWIYHCNYDFKTRTKIVISGEETSLADSMVYSATPTNSLVIFPPVNPNDPYILNVTNWQAGHRLIYGTNFVAASGQVSHTRTSISGRTATSGRVVTP